MSRRLRVLQVVPDLDYGGLQRLVVDTCRLLPPEEFDSTVLSFAGAGALAGRLPPGVQVLEPPAMSRFSLLRPAALSDQLRQLRPDVVHTHSGVWYKVARAAHMAGVPRVVHTDHGRRRPDPWSDRLIDGLASRYTDVIVAVSEVLAGQLRQTVVHDPARVRLLINGVDTEGFAPGPGGALRAELGLAPDVPILGSIGRFEHIKGYDVMLEAFARVEAPAAGGPAPVLVLAGDGAERRVLEVLAADRGLGARVRFLGFRADSLALLRDFTVFTLTSRSEGTSVSLLEAMSVGLCPVVTDVGGNRQVLGEALAHRLAPSGDPAGIARQWERALADPAARTVDGRAARARVVEGFSLARMVAGYAAIYRGG